mgnify:CR=1 FL=1
MEEPTPETTRTILQTLAPRYGRHHGLTFQPDGLGRRPVTLSVRYLPDRRLPDKAIDLMDEAAAQARLQLWPCPRSSRPWPAGQAAALARDEAIAAQDYEGAARYRDAETDFRRELEGGRRQWQAHQPTPVVTPQDVARTLSQWTGIPCPPSPSRSGRSSWGWRPPWPAGWRAAGGGGRRGPGRPPGPGRAEGARPPRGGPSSSWGPPGWGKPSCAKPWPRPSSAPRRPCSALT